MQLPSMVAIIVSAFSTAPSAVAVAHRGGLNGDGCHTDRRSGGYHCHRSRSVTRAAPYSQQLSPKTTPFRNCAEARAAGAAPVRAGDPGFSKKLDRDGDGIGCE